MKRLPSTFAFGGIVQSDGTIDPFTDEDRRSLSMQYAGEAVYVLGPVLAVEEVELRKQNHLTALHLNPTWEDPWPEWLEDPRGENDQ